MAKRSKKEEPAPKKRSLFSRIQSFVFTAVAVVIILYAAILVAARTAGFKSLVEDQLSTRSGYAVTIDTLSVTIGLNIEVLGLKVSAEGDPAPFLEVKEADLLCETAGLFSSKPFIQSIQARDVDLLIRETERSEWSPAALGDPMEKVIVAAGMQLRPGQNAAEAAWQEAVMEEEELAGADAADAAPSDEGPDLDQLAGWLKAIQVDVKGAGVRWLGKDGQIMASLQGLNILVTPLPVPERNLHHFMADIEQLRIQQQISKNLKIELLSTEISQVVLGLDADWGGVGP